MLTTIIFGLALFLSIMTVFVVLIGAFLIAHREEMDDSPESYTYKTMACVAIVSINWAYLFYLLH